MLRHRGAR